MNTLQFRARLIDPGDANAERPLEIYGTSRAEIDRWADKVLSSSIAENSVVMIYQMVESQVGMIPKPRPEKKS